MEVLIDTNVALDVILNNAGFVDNSRVILELAVTTEQFIKLITQEQ